MKQFNNETIPQHIAIIADGNRRWAKEHGLPILAGHQKVADKMMEPLVEQAAKKGVRYITFWAFSTENWQRDKKEIEGLLRLFRHIVRKKWQKLHEKGVRVKVIGDISKFPEDLQKSLKDVVEQTKNNQTITATFALNYGGRDEIVRAVNKGIKNYSSSDPALFKKYKDRRESREVTIKESSRLSAPSGTSSNNKITEAIFSDYLDTKGIPDPDLIVRTGGEQRLSGFLLWQSQYSELYFASWYMPEFTTDKLDLVIEEFQNRQRRYGK